MSADTAECLLWHMEDKPLETLVASCGVLLSPGLPGLVSPGQWSWTIQIPDHLGDAYLVVYIAYVTGPGNPGNCEQYFQCKY